MQRMQSTYTTTLIPHTQAWGTGYGFRHGQWPWLAALTLSAVVALFVPNNATPISHNHVLILLIICILCENEYKNTIENKRNSGLRLYKRCGE